MLKWEAVLMLRGLHKQGLSISEISRRRKDTAMGL
jgi:hypothetical protein